jgi:hypothetical protein
MPDTFFISEIALGLFEDPLLVIFNNEPLGSATHYAIEDISASPLGAHQPQAQLNFMEIQRVSAMGAGSGLSLDIVKASAAAPDLPSQVSIVLFPESLTVVSGAMFRKSMIPATGLNNYSAGVFLWNPVAGNRLRCSMKGPGAPVMWHAGYCNGATQALVMREGEGLFLGSSAYPANFMLSGYLTAILRDATNSRTYYVNAILPSNCHAPSSVPHALFGIMNNSGSGITLELLELSIYPWGATYLGGDMTNPYIRFARISRYDGGGISVTPAKANMGDTVPASLVVRKNDGVTPPVVQVDAGPNGLGIETFQKFSSSFWSLSLVSQGWVPYMEKGTWGRRLPRWGAIAQSNYSSGFIYFLNDTLLWKGGRPSALAFQRRKGGSTGLILPPQSGLGVMSCTASNYGVGNNMEAIITKLTLGVPTYPAEADVRDGTYYGPTGVEYEGDLVPGGGGGLPSGSVLVDSDSGDHWQYLKGPLIRRT